MYPMLIILMSLYTAMLYSMDDAKLIPPALLVNVSDGASIQNLASPLLTPSSLILDDQQNEIVLQPVREVEAEWPCGCRERTFLVSSCLGVWAIGIVFFVIVKYANIH